MAPLRRQPFLAAALLALAVATGGESQGMTFTFLPAQAFGINGSGDVVGETYLYDPGVPTTLTFPGSVNSYNFGINNQGQVVGWYDNGVEGNENGFLYSKGTFTTVNVPGAYRTQIYGINAQGVMVGWYADDASGEHAFVGTAGAFTSFNFPNSVHTEANGMIAWARSSAGMTCHRTTPMVFSTSTAHSPRSAFPGRT